MCGRIGRDLYGQEWQCRCGRNGKVWQELDWKGTARQDRIGLDWKGMVRIGSARIGVDRQGMAGKERSGRAGKGKYWSGLVWQERFLIVRI